MNHRRATTFRWPPLVNRLATSITRADGKTFVVGGAVRDQLLGHHTHDLDLVIAHLAPAQVKKIARQFGTIHEVGAQFGTLNLRVGPWNIDLALPRRDQKIATGHRGFAIHVDPALPIESDLARRDFTINAMAYDLATRTLVDPFHGRQDLARHLLRHVDHRHFSEDPLRLIRAFQFAARFHLQVVPATQQQLRRLNQTVRELPADRVRQEWLKMFVAGSRPSFGFKLAATTGYCQWRTTPTTLQYLDRIQNNHPERPDLLFSLWLVNQTPKKRQEFCRQQGLAHQLVRSITVFTTELDTLKKYPTEYQFSPWFVRELARRIAPHAITELAVLAPTHEKALTRAATAARVFHRAPKPTVRGQDLLQRGWAAGPALGRALTLADQLSDRGWTRHRILRLLQNSDSLMSATNEMRHFLFTERARRPR